MSTGCSARPPIDVELETPNPRVPLTTERALFEQAVAVGEELLFLHTYGERYAGSSPVKPTLPHGAARSTVAVPIDPDRYPSEFFYDDAAQQLRAGEGVFEPVSASVWNYEVSGLRVVHSWLSYRMKERGGKTSSVLDKIQPERWLPKFTDELLTLIWILERTIALGPKQEALLDAIVTGPILDASSLGPVPDEARQAPLLFTGQRQLFVPPGEQPQLDEDA